MVVFSIFLQQIGSDMSICCFGMKYKIITISSRNTIPYFI